MRDRNDKVKLDGKKMENTASNVDAEDKIIYNIFVIQHKNIVKNEQNPHNKWNRTP